MDATSILTGYNNFSLSMLDSLSHGSCPDSDDNFVQMIEKYIDLTMCEYDDSNELLTAPIPPSTGSSPQRSLQKSILLDRLPWFTTLAGMFDSGPKSFEETIARLQEDYDDSIRRTDENSIAYCAVLKGEIPSRSSTKSYQHIASRLLTIRFLDICCQLDVAEETSSNPDSAHPQIIGKFPKSISLPDWVNTLRNADALLESSESSLPTIPTSSTLLSDDQIKTRALFIYSERSQSKSDFSQIHANIGLACLAIRRILKGHLDNPQGSKEVDGEFGKGLTAPSYGWASLSRTLELVIAFGPLILFKPIKLSIIHISRARLTALWIQRGKARNPSVWSAEKRVWQRLVKIAQGASIEAEIKGMIGEEIHRNISQAARSWYDLEVNVAQNIGDRNGEDFLEFLQIKPPPTPPMPISTALLAHESLSLPNDVTMDPLMLLIDPALLQLQTALPSPPPSSQMYEDPGPNKVLPAEYMDIYPMPLPTPPTFESDSQSLGPGSSPAKSIDIEMQNDSTASATPEDDDQPLRPGSSPAKSIDIETQNDSSASATPEDDDQPLRPPEETPLPPPYDDCMEVNCTSPADSEMDYSPGVRMDAGVDEGMTPPSRKRRRFNPTPKSRGGHNPGTSHLPVDLPVPSSQRKGIKNKKVIKSNKATTGRQALGNSVDQPIDVDKLFAEEMPTLDVEDMPEKYQGELIRGYDSTGVLFEFTPALHLKEELDVLKAFDAAITAGFVNGLPLHVSDPENSAFFIVTEGEFELKSDEEIQAILRQKHILVTDMHSPALKFDSKGLSTLTTPSTVTYIQDQSISRVNNRLRLGEVRSLLRSSHEKGKVLNALHFPMPEQGMGMLPFSTDSAAWKCTKGTARCTQGQAPPLDELRWGLAATAGALSWWHVDSNGLGTYVDTKAGLKWWIVARRKGREHRFESFSEIDTFFGGRYYLDNPNLEKWDLEAVVLAPRTRLIMRPNTPHAVFTPDNAICHGGHFYATSTMQDTMFGIVHTFMSPNYLTNEDKEKHGLVLRRIAGFYHDVLVLKRLEEGEFEEGHVPKLTDFNSVLDLFTFCNVIFLMNVLDFRTYRPASQDRATDLEKHDANVIPAVERYEMAHARGRCWDIFCWFFSTYEIFDRGKGKAIDGFKEVAMAYLAHQGSVIVECKRRALKKKLDNGGHVTLMQLQRQLRLCFHGFEEIQAIEDPAGEREITLAFPVAERYGVRELVGRQPYELAKNLLELGTTAADAMYFKFLNPV